MTEIYILNTPILTSYGVFKFEKISIDKAKILLTNGFVSAVGHETTAEFMSEIIGIHIPMNRIAVEMKTGDTAVVFKILQRLPEGKVLSQDEIKGIPYEIGYLQKIS